MCTVMLYNTPVTKESSFHFVASLSHIPDFNELIKRCHRRITSSLERTSNTAFKSWQDSRFYSGSTIAWQSGPGRSRATASDYIKAFTGSATMLSLHATYASLDFMSQCAISLRPHCLELGAKLIRDAVDHLVHLPIPLSHPAGPFGNALICLFPSLFLSLRGVS